MRDFRDAKLMAQTLRKALSAKNIRISQGECLELVAKEFGVADWNTLSAKLGRVRPQAESVELKPTNWDTATKLLKHGMRLPLVPLRDVVVFPGMIMPL